MMRVLIRIHNDSIPIYQTWIIFLVITIAAIVHHNFYFVVWTVFTLQAIWLFLGVYFETIDYLGQLGGIYDNWAVFVVLDQAAGFAWRFLLRKLSDGVREVICVSGIGEID